MPPIVLFLICAALLIGAVYAVWRYWDNLVGVSPEEEAFDERVAMLNERQANRISDEELTHPVSEDDAWSIMVRRGRRRTTSRHDHDGGTPAQRASERRRRP